MSELLAAGKVPHVVEMDKHPENLLQGRMCEFPLGFGSGSQLIVVLRVNGTSRSFYQGGSSSLFSHFEDTLLISRCSFPRTSNQQRKCESCFSSSRETILNFVYQRG